MAERPAVCVDTLTYDGAETHHDTSSPSRVQLADGRVVDGDAIDRIVAWGGAE